eukprot:8424119-Karenia_brevis.AAC.1
MAEKMDVNVKGPDAKLPEMVEKMDVNAKGPDAKLPDETLVDDDTFAADIFGDEADAESVNVKGVETEKVDTVAETNAEH